MSPDTIIVLADSVPLVSSGVENNFGLISFKVLVALLTNLLVALNEVMVHLNLVLLLRSVWIKQLKN